jgi:hypothetical protein
MLIEGVLICPKAIYIDFFLLLFHWLQPVAIYFQFSFAPRFIWGRLCIDIFPALIPLAEASGNSEASGNLIALISFAPRF